MQLKVAGIRSPFLSTPSLGVCRRPSESSLRRRAKVKVEVEVKVKAELEQAEGSRLAKKETPFLAVA